MGCTSACERHVPSQAQLAALNADVRDAIFINKSMMSLPSNPRLDRLRGLVEVGASEVNTPEQMRDQILRMASYNKCDRELNATNTGATPNANTTVGCEGEVAATTEHEEEQCNQTADARECCRQRMLQLSQLRIWICSKGTVSTVTALDI